MKSLIVAFSLAITTALAACGGSSSGKSTGQDHCAAQACLRDASKLLASCPAQGTCVLDQVSRLGPATYCFANGFKLQVTEQILTGDGGNVLDTSTTTTYVAKTGATGCFVRIMSETWTRAGPAMSSILQLPSGETVASGHMDPTGTPWMVTCPGFQETTLDQSCGVSDAGLTQLFAYLGTSKPECTSGTCDF